MFDVVAIGAGAHGVNLHVDTSSLLAALGAEVADVTAPGRAAVYAVIRLLGTNLPCPGVPWNSPFSTST